MNNDAERMPPDAYQKAMEEAMQKYAGEKSMQDPDKNPVDSLIKPREEDNSQKPR